MKKTFLALIIALTIFACNQKKQQQPPAPETPKALQESGSAEYSLLSKRSGREDLVESLYAELADKTPELKDIEKQINYLDEARTDSVEGFNSFNEKNEDYYANALQHIAVLTDSALSNKIRMMISNSQSKYNTQISGHKSLLAILDSKAVKLQDMHVLLKIAKTLPLIEKYQKDNIPGKKPIEKTINEFDKTIKKIDSIANR
ncbi:MAG: hypothetical protein ABI921_11885 [Panacibacter sp.]